MSDNLLEGELRIFFRGLCIFYYKKKKEESLDDVKNIQVLLPDARIPENCYPYEYNINDPLFPHTPLLSIPKALLDPLPNEKPHKFTFDDDFIFPLKNHVIEIANDTENNEANELDIENGFAKFIPNLPEYAYDNKKKPIPIKRSLLKKGKDKLSKELSAFLEIDKGIISVPPHQNTDPRRAADYIRTVFEVIENSKNKPITVANCVCWDIKVKYMEKTKLSTKLQEIIDNLPNQEPSKPVDAPNQVVTILQNILDNLTSSSGKLLNKPFPIEELEEKLKNDYVIKEKSSLFKQLEDEYLSIDPKNFQELFEEIFLDEAKYLAIEAKNIAESISTDLFTHKYYPFTIKLKNGEDKELSLDLQLKPKIKKEKNRDVIVGAIPGNIYITNMPLEGVNMFPPFQRQRDLDFALTHSVLQTTPKDLILPRRIPSPDELNDQDQTLPPLACACVRYEEEV